MAYFDTENAVFQEQLRMLETTDPAHADVFNAVLQLLINNDVALKELLKNVKVPSKLSDLSDDSDHRTVTDEEKTKWNGLVSYDAETNTLNICSGGVILSIPITFNVHDYLTKNQGAENVGKIPVVGTDGCLTLIDMPEPGVAGDVVGTLDECNNLLLSGNLKDGTYTLMFMNEGDNEYKELCTFEVGAIAEPIQPVTVDIELIENTRVSTSDGGDRTQNGCCATVWVDLTSIPKPCTFNLTGIKWASESSASGYHSFVAWCSKDIDGNTQYHNYTSLDESTLSVVKNNDNFTDIAITITNEAIAQIRFSGAGSTASSSGVYGVGSMSDAKATLTYTPEA